MRSLHFERLSFREGTRGLGNSREGTTYHNIPPHDSFWTKVRSRFKKRPGKHQKKGAGGALRKVPKNSRRTTEKR